MSAQELKHFTLEDLNFGGTNFRDMQPQNKYCTWWGNQLVRLDRNACYLVDKKTGKETELMTLAQFNQWAGPTKDIKVRSLSGRILPLCRQAGGDGAVRRRDLYGRLQAPQPR